MLWSQLLISTRRDAPAGATLVSHQLLVRAGIVRENGPGVLEYLPLGLRVLKKLQAIVREELVSVGGREADSSAGLSGNSVGGNGSEARTSDPPATGISFGFRDREDQLPKHSLLRPRMSPMCDVLSSRAAHAGIRQAFERTCSRLGLPVVLADAFADSGATPATAYIVPAPAGDDAFLRTDKYAAMLDRAETRSRSWTFGDGAAADLEKIHTPGLKTVPEVAAALSVDRSQILKTLVFRTDARGPALASGVDPAWVVAVVRGDDRVNFGKLASVVRDMFRIAPLPMSADGPAAAIQSHWPVGFVGPDAAMRKPAAVLVVDYDAAGGTSWVVGASEPDYHLRHFNWFRECGDRLADPRKTAVGDIRYARAGDPAPGGGTLAAQNGFQVGHSIQPTPDSKAEIAIASEIDLHRLMLATVECLRDEHGIAWPRCIAPFSVVLVALGYKGEVRTAADRLYEQLNAAGIDTLLDDRDASPGVKFTDADLIGFAVRVTVGQRGLKEGVVEVKDRGGAEPRKVAADDVVRAVQVLLGQ